MDAGDRIVRVHFIEERFSGYAGASRIPVGVIFQTQTGLYTGAYLSDGVLKTTDLQKVLNDIPTNSKRSVAIDGRITAITGVMPTNPQVKSLHDSLTVWDGDTKHSSTGWGYTINHTVDSEFGLHVPSGKVLRDLRWKDGKVDEMLFFPFVNGTFYTVNGIRYQADAGAIEIAEEHTKSALDVLVDVLRCSYIDANVQGSAALPAGDAAGRAASAFLRAEQYGDAHSGLARLEAYELSADTAVAAASFAYMNVTKVAPEKKAQMDRVVGNARALRSSVDLLASVELIRVESDARAALLDHMRTHIAQWLPVPRGKGVVGAARAMQMYYRVLCYLENIVNAEYLHYENQGLALEPLAEQYLSTVVRPYGRKVLAVIRATVGAVKSTITTTGLDETNEALAARAKSWEAVGSARSVLYTYANQFEKIRVLVRTDVMRHALRVGYDQRYFDPEFDEATGPTLKNNIMSLYDPGRVDLNPRMSACTYLMNRSTEYRQLAYSGMCVVMRHFEFNDALTTYTKGGVTRVGSLVSIINAADAADAYGERAKESMYKYCRGVEFARWADMAVAMGALALHLASAGRVDDVAYYGPSASEKLWYARNLRAVIAKQPDELIRLESFESAARTTLPGDMRGDIEGRWLSGMRTGLVSAVQAVGVLQVYYRAFCYVLMKASLYGASKERVAIAAYAGRRHAVIEYIANAVRAAVTATTGSSSGHGETRSFNFERDVSAFMANSAKYAADLK